MDLKKKLLIILVTTLLIIPFISGALEVGIGGDTSTGDIGVNLIPDVPTDFSIKNVNHSNTANFAFVWVTDEGDINNVPNLYGTLDLRYLELDGSNFGFATPYLSYSNPDFDFNEVKLNATIDDKLKSTYHNPTQAEAVVGIIDGGTLADVQHSDAKYDGVTFNFSEEVGGLDLRINFTGLDVTDFKRGIMRFKTSNLKGDFPIVQMWSYENSAWEDYPSIWMSETFYTMTQPVFDGANHIQDGVAQMRIYKDGGNTQNHYYVDWIAIVSGVGLPSGSVDLAPYWRAEDTEEIGNFTTSGYVNASIGYFDDLFAGTVNVSEILANIDGDLYLKNNTDGLYNVSINTNYNITTSGRIGIGTESPTHELNVIGDVNITDDLFVGDSASIGASAITYDGLNIGSADGSDTIGIYHDDSSANFRWNDGTLYFQTDEGDNTATSIQIRGKGTGWGELNVQGSGEDYFTLIQRFGKGEMDVQGEDAVALGLEPSATVGIRVFEDTPEGTTQEIKIYGFKTGDGASAKKLEIGVGVDADDTASFDGVSNYYFDGNVGIGTTTPTHKLNVVGDVNISAGQLGVNITSFNSRADIQVGTRGYVWGNHNGNPVGRLTQTSLGRPFLEVGGVGSSQGVQIYRAGDFITFGTMGNKALNWEPSPRRVGFKDGTDMEVYSSGNDKDLTLYHDDTRAIIDTSEGDLSLMPVDNVGIGTLTPSYPLEVAGFNLTDQSISIYAEANISATGFITRTSVFDKSLNPFDFIKDTSYYLDGNNKVIHENFYGYAGEFETTDYSRPEVEQYIDIECDKVLVDSYEETSEECNIIENKIVCGNVTKNIDNYESINCKKIIKERTIYPYKTTKKGVELGKEIDVLRQGLFELKQENELMKASLCKLGESMWC